MTTSKSVLCSVAVMLSLASGASHADAKADATAACEAGKSAMTAAKEAGMLWTTTRKLMKKANGALEKGEYEAAMKACKQAEFEGNASVKQAAIEADAWKTRVPR